MLINFNRAQVDRPKLIGSVLDAAKAEFEASWRQWLAWAKLEEGE